MNTGTNVVLMQGNEAIVEGAIAAGVRFFAGYPITPATEILELFAQRMPQVGGKSIQMEDEIASLAAVIGASAGGVKAMTASSGPGMSLMVENIGLAITLEIPCVIVDVQRMGPATGLIHTSQGDMMFAKWSTPGGNEIIALVPSSVRETFELTIKAVNLSERFRVPVIILSDAHLGHMREKIRVPDQDDIEIVNRPGPTVPPEEYLTFGADEAGVPEMAPLGSKYRSEYTGSLHDKAGKYGPPPEERSFLISRLSQKILAHRDEILMIEKALLDDAQVAVLAYGVCARSAKTAVKLARAAKMKVGFLRPITVWPFPTDVVRQLAEQLKTIIVVEENLGQLVLEVERAAAGKAKVSLVNQYDGQLITPEKILAGIEEVY